MFVEGIEFVCVYAAERVLSATVKFLAHFFGKRGG